MPSSGLRTNQHHTKQPALSTERIAAFLDRMEAKQVELHSLLISQGEETLFETYWWPHTEETLHALHSATKSFTGLAVGFAIDEGKLSLDAPVLSFFPEFEPAPDNPNLALMTVRDLLTMRAGHSSTPSGVEWRRLTTSWVKEFLSIRVSRRPGEQFSYSSPNSHMLSAIVQRVVGEPVSEYLQPRLFQPLGITNYTWSRDPEGISSGGNGLSLTARDFLKWGQVYLQGGCWHGQQVVPRCWIQESSAAQVSPITNPSFDGKVYRPGTESDRFHTGYGYQVWRGPGSSYFAVGLFGQLCVVDPDRDLVVAINAASSEDGLIEDIFDVLLDDSSTTDDQDGSAALDARTLTNTRPPALSSAEHKPVSASYVLDDNSEEITSISVDADDDQVTLIIEDRRGHHTVTGGLGAWRSGTTTMSTMLLHHSYQDEHPPVEVGARWETDQTLVLDVIFVETPFHDTFTLKFNGDVVRMAHSVNVNSGATRLPEVTGRRRTR